MHASDADGAWGVWLVVGLATVFAALALVSTAAMSAAERRREFATLRLLGATRGHAIRMVALETLPTIAIALAAGAGIAAIAVAGVPRDVTGFPLEVPPELVGGLVAGASVLGPPRSRCHHAPRAPRRAHRGAPRARVTGRRAAAQRRRPVSSASESRLSGRPRGPKASGRARDGVVDPRRGAAGALRPGVIFVVDVPLCLAAIGLGLAVLPESRDPRAGRFDITGVVLSCAVLVLLVWPRFSVASATVMLLFFAPFGFLFLAAQHLQLVLRPLAVRRGSRQPDISMP